MFHKSSKQSMKYDRFNFVAVVVLVVVVAAVVVAVVFLVVVVASVVAVFSPRWFQILEGFIFIARIS